MAERFDIVGFDPRGLGASTPRVDCLTDAEFQQRRQDPWPSNTPAGIAETEQKTRDDVAKCVQRSGTELLAHVGTVDVVRDMDVIRAALGDDKLSYFGLSYGTRIGSTYAETFPDRIRAMVLDGAVDPAVNIIDAVGVARGLQKAFGAYAADCAKAANCPLGTDSAQATNAFRALMTPLIDHPAATADPRGLNYLNALSVVANSLYDPSGWPIITQGLIELKEGRGDVLLKIADVYAAAVDRDYQGAVLCADEKRITDRAEVAELDRQVRAVAPAFDDGRGTDAAPLDRCAVWPVPPSSQPHALAVAGVPKIVVVATTGDPVAPYQGAVNLARGLGAVLITYEGTQHGAVGSGQCVNNLVSAYLIDLVVPPDTTCPPR